jgi:hypothetical protein
MSAIGAGPAAAVALHAHGSLRFERCAGSTRQGRDLVTITRNG